MAALSVTTTPAKVPGPWADLQNLGSVDVYVDNSASVSSSTGIKIMPGGSYDNPRTGNEYWVVTASGTTDVRLIG